MAVRCGAKQIADFVVLWGMTGTSPTYCEYAEYAQYVKSLDLILSTLNVFVDAFCLNFEKIYRKYKVDFPITEEKFMEFLKPRCLLLTKDNRCFNFLLVCAFVSKIISEFSHYNKCFHLVKVASKCLAATLKNRFKRIFETDSDWEELMSFCIKTHSLVYLPERNCELYGNHLVKTIDKSIESDDFEIESGSSVFMTIEISIENSDADDNKNEEDWNTEMSGKKSSMFLNKDLTTEKNIEKLEDLCNLKASISTGESRTLQLKGEVSSLNSEDKEKIVDESNAKDIKEKDCSISGSEFSNMVIEKMVTSNYKADTEKLGQMIGLKKKLTLSFDKELTTKKVTGLCNLEPTSTNAFQLKSKYSSLKEVSEDVGNIDAENNARENDRDCTKDLTDSSFSNSTQKITKPTINNNDARGTEKLDQKNGCSRIVTLSFGDNLDKKNVTERLEDLWKSKSASTGAMNALQLKGDNSSIHKESQDKASIADEKNSKEDNEKGRTTDIPCSPSLNLAQEITMVTIYNDEESIEKLGWKNDCSRNVTLPFGDYLAIKKVTERLADLCNMEPTSTDALNTLQLKGFDSSTNDGSKDVGNLVDENNAEEINEKNCSTDMKDSSLLNSVRENDRIAINDNDKGTEKLGQMMSFKKHLTLSFGKYSAEKKGLEKLVDLGNSGPASSIDASHTLQLKSEVSSSNEELEDKEVVFDKSNARDNNKKNYATDSLLLELAHKLDNMSMENKTINNIDSDEKPDQIIGFRKKLTLGKDSNLENKAKILKDSANTSHPSTNTSCTFPLGHKESSRDESKEDRKQFNIFNMSSAKVRLRITENAQHLSEIMKLLKKCEGDIEPNLLSPDECDILIIDDEEEEDLEASSTSESYSNCDMTIFELGIRTILLAQNMELGRFVKRIFSEGSDDELVSKASGGESSDKMCDEVAYGNRKFAPEDPRCSLCAGGMNQFFYDYVKKFGQKYPNIIFVTDVFNLNFNEDSE